jgi:tRNA-dihydrouridine synthase A
LAVACHRGLVAVKNLLLHPVENTPSHRFCVAPMMDYTDRHCRYLLRLLSQRALLYTEMMAATAITQGPLPHRLLDFDPAEHPVALQLGGSNPHELAQATRAANKWGYDEVNLNVGCPSSRVTSGRFGACLMAEPILVADCVKAMCDVSSVPITVKTRIGIDHLDEDHHLDSLVEKAAEAGCRTFIIHARKAWLKGLSPKQNREIPPLNYDRVIRLKRNFPELEIILNGGLQAPQAAQAVLTSNGGIPLDGVMLGRSIYAAPYLLANVDHLFFSEESYAVARCEVVTKYFDYARTMVQRGARPHHIFRHIVGLYHGCTGARIWRQAVTRIGQGADSSNLYKLAQSLDTGLFLAA